MNVIARQNRETWRVFVETLLGEDAEILSRTRMDAVLDRTEQTVGRYPRIAVFGVRAALLAFEWGAVLLMPARRRFCHLSSAERLRYLDTWEYSSFGPRRNAHLLLKMTVLSCLLRETEVLEFIGYQASMRRRMERPAEGAEMPCPKRAAS